MLFTSFAASIVRTVCAHYAGISFQVESKPLQIHAKSGKTNLIA